MIRVGRVLEIRRRNERERAGRGIDLEFRPICAAADRKSQRGAGIPIALLTMPPVFTVYSCDCVDFSRFKRAQFLTRMDRSLREGLLDLENINHDRSSSQPMREPVFAATGPSPGLAASFCPPTGH